MLQHEQRRELLLLLLSSLHGLTVTKKLHERNERSLDLLCLLWTKGEVKAFLEYLSIKRDLSRLFLSLESGYGNKPSLMPPLQYERDRESKLENQVNKASSVVLKIWFLVIHKPESDLAQVF